MIDFQVGSEDRVRGDLMGYSSYGYGPPHMMAPHHHMGHRGGHGMGHGHWLGPSFSFQEPGNLIGYSRSPFL